MSSKDLPVYVYPADLLKDNDNTRCVSFIAINSLKTNGSDENKDKGALNYTSVQEGESEAFIYLPTPLNLGDNQSHAWSQETTVNAFEKLTQSVGGLAQGLGLNSALLGNKMGAMTGALANMAGNLTTGMVSVASNIGKAPVVGLMSMMSGKRKALVNPGYFQNYTASTPRTFEFNYVFHSRNQQEALTILNIIRSFKMYSSPTNNADEDAINDATSASRDIVNAQNENAQPKGQDSSTPSEFGAEITSDVNAKIAQVFGYMGQPNFWKITFGNPYLDKLIRTDYVVCTSVSATYGNGSKLEMYKDGIPKVITLQLSFSEVKLKMRNDFAEVFRANEKTNNNFVNVGDRYMINNSRRQQIDAATNGANKSIPMNDSTSTK